MLFFFGIGSNGDVVIQFVEVYTARYINLLRLCHVVVMARSVRIPKEPSRFDPSLANQHSQLEGSRSASCIETDVVVSSCVGPSVQGVDVMNVPSVLPCRYPGEVNTQFWGHGGTIIVP